MRGYLSEEVSGEGEMVGGIGGGTEDEGGGG